jgi:hypothetical protein
MQRHQEHWKETPKWIPEMPPEKRAEVTPGILDKIVDGVKKELKNIDNGF